MGHKTIFDLKEDLSMNIYRIENYMYHECISECKDKQKIEELRNKTKSRDIEVLSELARKGTVFEYHYFDAWWREIIKLEVFKNNTAVIEYDNLETTIDIKPELIEGIYSIAKRYCDEYRSGDHWLEDPCVYDGYMYMIRLSDGNDYYLCNTDNIQDYDETTPNGYRFVLMLKEIFALLKQAGIEHDKFRFQ